MTEKNDKQVFGRFLRTKNDQKNEVNPESWTQLKGSNEKGI